MIDIELHGFEELSRALHAMAAHIERRGLIDALRAGARLYQKEAQERVPQRTGQLRRSIVVRTRGPARATVMVKRPGSYYAHLVENGTAPHRILALDGEVLRIGPVFIGRTVEHPGARPQPFMRPAFDEHTDDALGAVRIRLGRNVERIALELAGGARARFTRPQRVRSR